MVVVFCLSNRTVGSVRGTLKPRGRVPRPGLKIIESAAMIAATAAAATVGAVLVIGPGGAAAAGYALAASDSRCTTGSRSAASDCPPGSQGQAGNGPGRARGPPASISVGPAPVTCSPRRGQSHPEGRPGGDGTVTQTVARLAARARGPARRRDSFDIADSELES